mmetsp:Transcript_17996/g.48977  ORF Transcript_17996/g.48977 Transcript_17996/m.48977 type:complete len:453 (+) Transcript_17996:117-1475(+)
MNGLLCVALICSIGRGDAFHPPTAMGASPTRRSVSIGISAKNRRRNSLSEDEGCNRHEDLSRRRIIRATVSAAGSCVSPSGLYLPRPALALDSKTQSTTAADAKIPTVRLGGESSTLSVSRTIQGYWQLAGGHGLYKDEDAKKNMKAHFDVGMTTLDTADIYGPSELLVGQFMSQQKQRQSKQKLPTATTPIPCTKFCCFRLLEDINRQEVKERIQRACERLQVSRLPLVQFFWSNYDAKRYVDVALYLTELKDQGYIQEIGATNFDLPRLKELHKADVPLVSHQVQLSCLDRRPVQSGMSDWCKDNQVSLIGFGTVASGILSEKFLGRPEPLTQQERTTASLRMYSATAQRFGDWSLVQELLNVLNEVAIGVREDGRCLTANISNIAQRYVLQTPAVAAVLIGVRNQDHIAENVATHSFTLKSEEIEAIDRVVSKRKGPRGDVWDIERGAR